MTINKLGSIDPLAKYNKTEKSAKVEVKNNSDSISVSSEAKKSAELLQVMDKVQLSPDVRESRIAEVKAKLEDPNYINDSVLDALAGNLMDVFGI